MVADHAGPRVCWRFSSFCPSAGNPGTSCIPMQGCRCDGQRCMVVEGVLLGSCESHCWGAQAHTACLGIRSSLACICHGPAAADATVQPCDLAYHEPVINGSRQASGMLSAAPHQQATGPPTTRMPRPLTCQ